MLGSGEAMQAQAQALSQKEDLVRFKMQMDGLKNRLSGRNKEQELKEACVQFEAVFINQLWKEMRKSVPKEGYLHSKMEEQYLSMFDRQFSEHLAEGGGLGLADMLYEQLKRNVEQAAHRTLGGGEGGPAPDQTAQPMPLDKNGEEGVSVDPRSAAARVWDNTRRQADPEQAQSELMREVEALAEKIVAQEQASPSQALRRQAARSYSQEMESGRHIAKQR
jgi:flagellar protein FlgJ